MYDDDSLDEDDPWSGILAATMFAARATYHTTLGATPSQLVFGRDAILNTKFEADWNIIKTRKQKLIHKNNLQENSKRVHHVYKVDDEVLYKKIQTSKYGSTQYDGPFKVTKVNDNGTVSIRRGAVIETVNIRLLKPYFG